MEIFCGMMSYLGELFRKMYCKESFVTYLVATSDVDCCDLLFGILSVFLQSNFALESSET